MIVSDTKLFVEAIESMIRMPRKQSQEACNHILEDRIPAGALPLYAECRKKTWYIYNRYAHLFPSQLLTNHQEPCLDDNKAMLRYWELLHETNIQLSDPESDHKPLPDMREVVSDRLLGLFKASEKNCEQQYWCHFL